MERKTIIFDFDGTIADTLLFHYQKVHEITERFKLADLSHQDIIKKIRSKTPQELVKEFKPSWLKIPFIFSVIKRAQKELINQIDQIKVFPGMESTLNKLKKYAQLGILSSNLKENIDKFLLINKLQVFDFVNYEQNIFGKDKALLNLIKKHSLIKDNTYYVGDEVRDIEACKKIGIKSIVVSWGLHTEELLKKYKPDYLISQADELLDIIKRNGK